MHSEPVSPASPDSQTAADKLKKELAAAEAVASAGGGSNARDSVEVDLDDIYGN
jgi:hypothetical protein